MAQRAQGIVDTGFTVVYEPEHDLSPAIVDIIIVHGLQGHPFTTWAYTKPTPTKQVMGQNEGSSPMPPQQIKARGRFKGPSSFRNRLLAKFGKGGKKEPKKSQPPEHATVPDGAVVLGGSSGGTSETCVFWPRDLLPNDCPRSRILVYGYDSNVTKYMKEATNKNHILSHGKDLLFALGRIREVDRPLIFIAHSLGGIVVKELLTQSSVADEGGLRNIVDSTASVIFLGTPHRGSPDAAAVGGWARALVGGALRMDSNPAILDALGLRTTDLERAQESFSRIWHNSDFRVKTFQESLGLTGVNISVLGDKVVPDSSSLIGDARERAETMQANHRDMCRFSGPRDSNYEKLLGEIMSVYKSLVMFNRDNIHHEGRIQRWKPFSGSRSTQKPQEATDHSDPAVSESERSALKSLWYPGMNDRKRSLEKPAAHTCNWLFEQQSYQDWYRNTNQEKHRGLIWLKGKPGAGKSVLMCEAFRRAKAQQQENNCLTAAFFFNAKGRDLEHSHSGMVRSLLYQLLPHQPHHLRRLVNILSDREEQFEGVEERPTFQYAELERFVHSVIGPGLTERVILFIDALDECDSESIRNVAYLFRDITRSTPNLSVCISSRQFPSVSVTDCPEIIIDHHNSDDINGYIRHRLDLGMPDDNPEKAILQRRIFEKSAGVFLWVSLVVDDVLTKWDEGKTLSSLLDEVNSVPEELEALYSSILRSIKPEDHQKALRLFHWAILSTRPLRLYEWDHVLAFIVDNPPQSLSEWRPSVGERRGQIDGSMVVKNEHGQQNDHSWKIERQLRSLSRGLIEVQGSSNDASHLPITRSRPSSVHPGAGSLEFDQGENRIVQVIHESVREFFLHHRTYAQAGESPATSFAAEGHISILETCLDYLCISELDALVEARNKPRSIPGQAKTGQPSKSVLNDSVSDGNDLSSEFSAGGESTGSLRKAQSVASFGSAYSYGSHRNSIIRVGRTDTAFPFRSVSTRSPSISPSLADHTSAELDLSLLFREGSEVCPNPHPRGTVIPPGSLPERGSIYEEKISEPVPIIRSTTQSSTLDKTRASEFQPSANTGLRRTSLISYIPSVAQDSAARETKVLEDFPALLSYATFELFTHAKLGQIAEADPIKIVRRLGEENGRYWTRWVCLAEQFVPHTGLLFHAANLGLNSWFRYLGSCEGHSLVDDPSRTGNTPEGSYCQCGGCKQISLALMQAIKRRSLRIFEVLLRYFGYRKSYRTRKGTPVVHVLARLPDSSFLQMFLSIMLARNKDKGDASGIDETGTTELLEALRTLGQNDSTPLHVAVIKGKLDNVSELLKYGCNVKACDLWGKTALHHACFDSRLAKGYDIARLLVEAGAAVNAVDSSGDAALRVLCRALFKQNQLQRERQGNLIAADPRKNIPVTTGEIENENSFKLLRFLLEHGVDVNLRNNDGASALHIPCSTDFSEGKSVELIPFHLHALRLLFEFGADPTKSDHQGNTPLHIAIQNLAPWDIIKELIRHGASTTQRNNLGWTPLHCAIDWANVEAAQQLLSLDPSQVEVKQSRPSPCNTPLSMACQRYEFSNDPDYHDRITKVIKVLLVFGADINNRADMYGRFYHQGGDDPSRPSILQRAEEKGLESLVELLLSYKPSQVATSLGPA